jgi:hypothetical protein
LVVAPALADWFGKGNFYAFGDDLFDQRRVGVIVQFGAKR